MKRANWLLLCGGLFLSSIIFLSLFNAGQITWDDDSNIFGNPYFTMHMWWGVWTEPYFGLYVPITSSAWAALYYLGHGQAWPFRIFNVALHAANIVLVFLILRNVSQRWAFKAPIAAGLAVGIFALHPLQSESVAWISGGRDLLAAFFALLSTVVYFHWRSRKGYVVTLILFMLGLLSKPNIVVLPLAFMLIEFFAFGVKWPRALLRMSPFLVLSLVATLLTQAGQEGHYDINVEWYWHPWIMADSYFFYLQKVLWPHPLAANYDHRPEKLVGDFAQLWKVAALFALVGTGGFYAFKFERRFLWAGLWFVLLLPVTGIVDFGYQNISTVADHYMYLPMVVVAVMFMLLIEKLWRYRILVLVPLVLNGVWSWATWERLSVWENDANFFMDMAKMAPDSFNTAMGMSVVMCQDEKNYSAGVEWTDKALRIHENNIMALANRAYCLLQAGRLEDVVAMDSYLDKLDPETLTANNPTAYSSLMATIGNALIQLREFEDGFQFLCEAYRVKPSEQNHRHNLQVATEMLKAEGLQPVCQDPGKPELEDVLNLFHSDETSDGTSDGTPNDTTGANEE